MYDYWNDPPDEAEPPECCGDFMDCFNDGSCKCPTCGKTIDPPADPDPSWEVNDFPEELGYPQETKCPHGNAGECDRCDYLSDIAYDAAREARFFGL